jgi:hypothetical protein
MILVLIKNNLKMIADLFYGIFGNPEAEKAVAEVKRTD